MYWRSGSLWVVAVLWAAMPLVLITTVSAEQLPVKTYTAADGLLRDEARCIKQDSRGFLWFCTADGVSRFDGYSFTNYTTDDGLPHRVVNDLLETRSGVIWIATENGLARFNPKGKRSTVTLQFAARNPVTPIFVSYWPEEKRSREITVLLEDLEGKLWCGTGDGLYWFEEGDGKGVFHRFGLPKERPDLPLSVLAIIQDRQQNLWVGLDYRQGLNRITPDGRIEHYSTRREGHENESITTLLQTREGKIWVGMGGSEGGLCSLVAEPGPHRPIFSRCYTKRDGLPTNWISALYQTSDGKLWVGTTDGTASFDPNFVTVPQFHVYRKAQELSDEGTLSLCEDREGNLWIATTNGVKKISRSGFVRYAAGDGLAQPNVVSIFVSHNGELFIITKQSVESADKKTFREIHLINRFDGSRFTSVIPNLPMNAGTGWGGGQIVMQDQAGQWWLPSNKQGAFRFPQVSKIAQLSSVKPQAVQIPDNEVFRLYEDFQGDVWIGTMYLGRILKWERRTEKLHDYTGELDRPADVPDPKFHLTCFAEDGHGTLWAGFYNHHYLMRYRAGRFSLLPINGEKSGDSTYNLYFDHAGRLWLATRLNGVGRIDDPNATQLNVVWYNRRKGLATDSIQSLTEDNFGHIYAGHPRGVDRIDVNTGQIKHYTAADGLPTGMIQYARRDAQGALWFGGRGLARFIPEPDKPRQAPTILLTGLRVAGEKQPVSELGEESLPALRLGSLQTQVGVDFLGLGASLGEELMYQYKLEGAQDDWSQPTTQRSVDFANLSPGAYRLLVKAATAEGTESAKPAVFAFTILRPVWQRPWFLLLIAAALGLTLHALYRYRLARLLELERVRTRIATDLHDDIGSNLSLIAMLSEVTLRAHWKEPKLAESLSLIADTSRELVDGMSDIVWAVNPQKDSVRDLAQRMRRFASEVFSARNIAFKFRPSTEVQDAKLGTDTRREVFLIFKEAVNNIARHSNGTEAGIELTVAAGWLVMTLRDNGKGFAPVAASEGNGLVSMRQRAERLGGKFEVNSGSGQGTTVTLKVPMGR